MTRIGERARGQSPPDLAARDFYEPALRPDEWALYRRARAEQGLSGEVALLRLRLHRLLGGRAEAGGTEDGVVTTQLLRIVDLLVKALRAHGSEAGEEQAALERVLDEEAIRVLNRRSEK
ncbi:MAG TPA: hypothetical protein VNL71_08755 [Chloroflexota bacterium]|nr:hypothetical protein [Chloroflexota bacterium]